MKPFEIWTCIGGIYASKPRPVAIAQAMAFDDFDSITVLPLTSDLRTSIFRVELKPSTTNALAHASCVMIDKITTVRKNALHQKIGVIDAKCQKNISTKMALFLGI